MADITKTIKFLLLGDDSGARKALKSTSKGFSDTVKSAEGIGGKAKMAGGAIVGLGAAAAVAGAAIAVKFGQDEGDAGVTGLTNGGVSVRDLGEIDAKPAFRTRIEFFCGVGVFGGKAAARSTGWLNA